MKSKGILQAMGPGLLWAGAAIGVSHLVQSTRAGAIYGFDLVWIILIINIFKYPFFEFGPRYAVSTGESLIEGYRRMGRWGPWLYFVLTVATMFTIQGAVTLVTAGLFASVFGLTNTLGWVIIILLAGVGMVIFGKYKVLDKTIKIIVSLLAVSTIFAVIAASTKGFHPQAEYAKHFTFQFTDIALLIAFAGWMPSAIDISVWHSMWSLAKDEGKDKKTTLRQSLLDFNIGYIGTSLLSIGFLSLGALIMYGSGRSFASNGTLFAGQFIQLFTSSLGKWSYALIATAALTTMFSTTITCLDAYPRVLKPTTEILIPSLSSKKTTYWISWMWMLILIFGTILLITAFVDKMSVLVDLATTLSFLTAPILGYMNFKAVMGKQVPKEARPPLWLQILSKAGLVVLTGSGLGYLIWKFFIT